MPACFTAFEMLLIVQHAGVKLILTPTLSAMFNRAGMLAADGRCKTLDASADGYVRGEAAATLLIIPQPSGQGTKTAADHNTPLAVLAGSAINQDGRSSGLTAPNGPAQQAVLRSALSAAGMDSSHLAQLQLHGTGALVISFVWLVSKSKKHGWSTIACSFPVCIRHSVTALVSLHRHAAGRSH
jgi:hypothetical protein